MKKFSEFNIQPNFPLTGVKEYINNIINKPIIIQDFKFMNVQGTDGLVPSCQIQFRYPEETVNRIVFTRSTIVRDQLQKVDKQNLPFEATFKRKEAAIYLD